MTLRFFFILIAFFIEYESFGQKSEIASYSDKIDSLIINNKNIVLQLVQHKQTDDSVRYFDSYYIDTSKGVLVKSIYEFNFEGDGEYLDFFYRNDEIIKVNARHKLSERKFSGTFYFKSKKLIEHTDGEINTGKIVFSIEEILKTGDGHLTESSKILKTLKKKNM